VCDPSLRPPDIAFLSFLIALHETAAPHNMLLEELGLTPDLLPLIVSCLTLGEYFQRAAGPQNHEHGQRALCCE